MSDSCFQTPWNYHLISLKLKKSIHKYLTSVTQKEVSESWVLPALGPLADFQLKPWRERSRTLGKVCVGSMCSGNPSYLFRRQPLKHLTTLPPSSPTCGYIVSFKKAFPSAIFAQVFPLYTLFSGQLQRTGERRSAKCNPTLISNAQNSADPNQPLPSHLLPSHPLGSHSLLLGNYVFWPL